MVQTALWKESFYLTMHSTHFIYGYMVIALALRISLEGHFLINDALNTFYLWLYGVGGLKDFYGRSFLN